MSKIAYLILCHKNASSVGDWIDAHISTGNYVAVHFDKRGSDADYDALVNRFSGSKEVLFVPRRKCGWGEWSLVEASLAMLREALKTFRRATHFYLVSGDCVPIKPAEFIRNALDENSIDYIEAQDFVTSGWIQTGMVEDRYQYRHFFNEREKRRAFYRSLGLQRLLGLKRSPPNDLKMKIGSQWWCVRRKTAEAIFDFLAKRKEVERFFKTVWIPDESFFQTVVSHIVPTAELSNHPPTFLTFSDYGMPVVFHTDHLNYLREQPRFFARKASPHQEGLLEKFSALYMEGSSKIRLSDKGKAIYDFTVQSGREGRRFELPVTKTGGTIGRERTVHIIVCKDWWVGKTFAKAISKTGKILSTDYLFHEEDASLPDLGGFEDGLSKRQKHRRAFVKMVMDIEKSEKIIFCVDPAFTGILSDFEGDICKTRYLYLGTDLTDQFCAGHAHRLGLLTSDDPEEDESIIRTMRHNLTAEQQAVLELGLGNLYRLDPHQPSEENTKQLAEFANITKGDASKIIADAQFEVKGGEHVL